MSLQVSSPPRHQLLSIHILGVDEKPGLKSTGAHVLQEFYMLARRHSTTLIAASQPILHGTVSQRTAFPTSTPQTPGAQRNTLYRLQSFYQAPKIKFLGPPMVQTIGAHEPFILLGEFSECPIADDAASAPNPTIPHLPLHVLKSLRHH